MVQFGTGYYMPMDREYFAGPSGKTTSDVGVGMGDIGMSIGLGPTPNVPSVGAKLRSGMKSMELCFMGSGKGSGQGHTPEMYGKLQRQALREMQKANEVNFTTHASVGVYGMAGMDQRGNFSRQSKSMALEEIKRAIDFAADVSRGGPVVVHTGEFYRPIVEAGWNKEGGFKGKFQMFEGEGERASYRVVDNRTGAVIEEARKNRNVSKPVWKRYDAGDEFWSKNGGKEYTDALGQKVKPGDYIDYFGNKLNRDMRVPRYDEKQGKFLVRQVGWEELEKEADELTRDAREEWEKYQRGEISRENFEKGTWSRFKEAKSIEEVKVRAEEAYIISTLETNAANSRGWALYYSGQFDEIIRNIEKLRKAKDIYKKIEESTSPEEQWRLKKQAEGLAGGLVPTDAKFPSEIIDRQLKELERHMNYSKESSASQWAHAEEAQETIKHVESAETYGLKEAYDAYAQAGIQAMLRTDQLAKVTQLNKPVTVAMENMFPESFGSHPNEVIELIQGSRKKMEELLMKRGLSEREAHERAEKHIVATFDTGHMNMWRKYWQDDPHQSMEKNDEDFRKWMLGKVAEMAEKKIIGHVHLVDNFGYQDDHLSPGEGNTPIKEIVKILKEKGFKGEMVIEPAADFTLDTSGFQGMMKAWKYFGSSTYGAPGIAPRKWGEVQNSYFGGMEPPYFIFAPYAPSEDWTLWSGAPME